jgi:colicin import membrane protein
VNSATAKEGDAKLCKAAISAITRAKIPAAPDNETYQRVKNLPEKTMFVFMALLRKEL